MPIEKANSIIGLERSTNILDSGENETFKVPQKTS
jgi:hypothetical protein